MKAYTDFSFACLNVIDTLNQPQEPLAPAVELLKQICLHDPTVGQAMAQIPRMSIPNLCNFSELFPYMTEQFQNAPDGQCPSWLIYNIITSENSVDIVASYPETALFSQNLVTFAHTLKPYFGIS